ncbi:hypothetical protein PTSG_11188 [Salpingoeca rosetta]|uniref:Autophagy protein 5 n=1 Tax=Salpingoeca rosetta (strain ATCC 50818 / BSB-021) TaxID=946362 RepID=F2USP0_SALR5|nr:uncharacterized protein PTSG_11188 [Salpingoeca rosetta]EGD81149.1 hypothetical protein PTSG_11188 [Salpingoeca rosetta]|eukprot:XP_004987834.1 hypothetical protein PTSG_11188 [Salpingoeca rosetta]
MDEAVERQLWTNRVPIAFKLSEADEPRHGASSKPRRTDTTCYMMVPRMAYLPFASEALASFFSIDMLEIIGPDGSHQPSSLQASELEAQVKEQQPKVLWFEFKGYPLKWHVPVGVLFDALTGDIDDVGRPWEITVHTKNFPAKALLPYSTIEDLQRHFLCRLKEACFIKQGTLNLDELGDVQTLKRLWSGLLYDNYNDFQDVNQHLMSTPDNNWFKQFPFCLYMTARTGDTGPWEITQMVREPFGVADDEGMPLTLSDLLSVLLGGGFTYTNATATTDVDADADDDDDNGGDDGDDDDDGTEDKDKKVVMTAGEDNDGGEKQQVSVIVQGVEPPLDTPLQWLAAHMSHADNFCHVIVRLPSTP